MKFLSLVLIHWLNNTHVPFWGHWKLSQCKNHEEIRKGYETKASGISMELDCM